ncbi:MAG TPA: flagellar biosynthesis anti-sigma factor FlgM [Phycisphaerales bacterium]|nr:flagellar biosynthesis anti-sigma factor FlgM [Phycisphaerales bacterium]
MPDISSISSGGGFPIGNIQSVYGGSSASKATSNRFTLDEIESQNTASVVGEDRVELSDHAKLIDRLRNLPDVRADRVAQAKAAIARGDYDTPDALDKVLNGLLEDLQ